MKNKNYTIAIAIIILMLIGLLPFKGSTVQAEETTYIYNVDEADCDFRIDSKSAKAHGFYFGEEKHQVGTQFTVAADFEQSNDYTMSIGDYSEIGTCFEWYMVDICLGLPSLPYSVDTGVENDLEFWDQTRLELGPSIFRYFYFLPNNLSESIEWTIETRVNQERYSDDWTFTHNNGTFNDDTGIARFSWIANGQYKNKTEDTNFSGTYEFLFHFSKSTGILQGYRIDFDYSGKIRGMKVNYVLLLEVELAGYNLPDRISHGISGFDWVIGIFTLLFLTTNITIKKKYSRKNNRTSK